MAAADARCQARRRRRPDAVAGPAVAGMPPEVIGRHLGAIAEVTRAALALTFDDWWPSTAARRWCTTARRRTAALRGDGLRQARQSGAGLHLRPRHHLPARRRPGGRPDRRAASIANEVFFARLAQRLDPRAHQHAPAPASSTRSDMRLRPERRSGLLVVQPRRRSASYQASSGLGVGAPGADPRPRRSPAIRLVGAAFEEVRAATAVPAARPGRRCAAEVVGDAPRACSTAQAPHDPGAVQPQARPRRYDRRGIYGAISGLALGARTIPELIRHRGNIALLDGAGGVAGSLGPRAGRSAADAYRDLPGRRSSAASSLERAARWWPTAELGELATRVAGAVAGDVWATGRDAACCTDALRLARPRCGRSTYG
ncbi:MAG: hypothetical protein MZV65_37385 [Chromatiales bacterium]|nr:hypothetical protein [Chromatiales bacterium]